MNDQNAAYISMRRFIFYEKLAQASKNSLDSAEYARRSTVVAYDSMPKKEAICQNIKRAGKISSLLFLYSNHSNVYKIFSESNLIPFSSKSFTARSVSSTRIRIFAEL